MFHKWEGMDGAIEMLNKEPQQHIHISRVIKFCSTDCRNEYREQAINGLAIPLADLKTLDELDDRCGCCFEMIGGE